MSSYVLEKNIDDEGNCELIFNNENIDVDFEDIKECNLINLKYINSKSESDTANATIDIKSLLNNPTTSNTKKLNVSAKEMDEVSPIKEKQTSNSSNYLTAFIIIIIILVILFLVYYFWYLKKPIPFTSKNNSNIGNNLEL